MAPGPTKDLRRRPRPSTRIGCRSRVTAATRNGQVARLRGWRWRAQGMRTSASSATEAHGASTVPAAVSDAGTGRGVARPPRMNPRTAPPDLLAALGARFGERLSTAQTIRDRHGQDESYHAPSPPDAVVFPRSTDEVVDIVRLCAASGTP